jgi:hypothetical protein
MPRASSKSLATRFISFMPVDELFSFIANRPTDGAKPLGVGNELDQNPSLPGNR